jgi:hypothetical protein
MLDLRSSCSSERLLCQTIHVNDVILSFSLASATVNDSAIPFLRFQCVFVLTEVHHCRDPGPPRRWWWVAGYPKSLNVMTTTIFGSKSLYFLTKITLRTLTRSVNSRVQSGVPFCCRVKRLLCQNLMTIGMQNNGKNETIKRSNTPLA